MIAPRITTFVLLLCSSILVKAERVTEVPIEYSHGLIWLKARLNNSGTPHTFLLDSGAQASLLSVRTAKDLGLPFGGREIVQGVGSQTSARWVDDLTICVGPLHFQTSALALDLRALSQVTNRQIDGVLGMDFFRDRVVQIDFASSRLRLLDRYSGSRASISLPIKHHNEAMLVPVGVGGEKPRWARLDTGSNQDLQWNYGGSRMMPVKRGTAVGLASRSLRHTRESVQLGKVSFEDRKIGIHNGPIFPGEAGLLGNGLLSRFKVTIDCEGRVVFLEPR